MIKEIEERIYTHAQVRLFDKAPTVQRVFQFVIQDFLDRFFPLGHQLAHSEGQRSLAEYLPGYNALAIRGFPEDHAAIAAALKAITGTNPVYYTRSHELVKHEVVDS